MALLGPLGPRNGPRGLLSYSIFIYNLVGRTGFEPVTFSVSGRRAPAAPTARDDESLPGRARCCAAGTGARERASRTFATPPTQASIRGSPNRAMVLLSTNRVTAEIRSPSSVSTIIPCARNTEACGVLQVAAEGRLPVGPRLHQPVAPGTAPARDVAQEAGDRFGALELQRDWAAGEPASSVSSATTPSMSLPAKAVANRDAMSRSRAERGSGTAPGPGPGAGGHGGPGPLQRTGHRGLAAVQHVCHLG